MSSVPIRRVSRLVVEPSTEPRPTVTLDVIESGSGRVLSELPVLPPDGQVAFEAGDVLFSKLRPYLAKSLLVDEKLQGTGELLALRTGNVLLPRFLFYVTLSATWLDWATRTAYGLKMPRTSWEQMADFPLHLPPLDEQRGIADFLDDQVARVDSTIDLRIQERQLLEELWEGSLERAMSQDADQVPLKAAVWWQEGPGILSENFVEDGLPIMRIAHLRSDDPTSEATYFVDSESGIRRWGHFLTEEGDLMISGSAAVGAMAVWVTADLVGWIPFTGLIRVRPRIADLDPAYMRYFFLSRAFTEQVDRLKQGVGIQHWGPSHLSQVRLGLPKLKAQREVVAELERLERDVHQVISATSVSIDLLGEYKRSLITAAVTGELDVTTARRGVRV